MMLYNITFNIEENIENEWLSWTREFYIAKVMHSGLFRHYRLFKLLSEQENNGITYALQFYADNLNAIDEYIEHHAPAIVKEHNERFKYKQVAFMTLLESVDI